MHIAVLFFDVKAERDKLRDQALYLVKPSINVAYIVFS